MPNEDIKIISVCGQITGKVVLSTFFGKEFAYKIYIYL